MNTTVNSISIDGKNILYGTPKSATAQGMAKEIAEHINACQAWSATSNPLPGTAKCETAGYSATWASSGSGSYTVRIYTPISGPRAYRKVPPYNTMLAVPINIQAVDTATGAPSGSAVIVAPTVAAPGQQFITASNLDVNAAGSNTGRYNVPGVNTRVLITKPGTSPAASTLPTATEPLLFPHPQYSRSDCTGYNGMACTYEKEMENLANWYTYYQTRLQLMKTSSSLAFQTLLPSNPAAAADPNTNPTQYRVGFMTINNNNGNDFFGVSDFAGANIKSWYDKVFGTKFGKGTPLRGALSTAGQYYAGKLGTVNGVTAADPDQYSCQQNFSILFTDGTWTTTVDSSKVVKLDGTTAIGNQDGTIANDAGDTPTVPQLDRKDYGNTLADVTEYYYTMDLRTSNCQVNGQDVCSNNVPPAGRDTATWQHMTTLTLGLGASGNMLFDPAYLSGNPGDYTDVVNGVATAGGTGSAGTPACPWQVGTGLCTWPDPGPDAVIDPGNEPLGRIDDLWHAAVNGRGTYYAVNNASDLAAGLNAVLTQIQAATSSSGASTPSVPNIVAGENTIYSSSYVSQKWSGDLVQQDIDLGTGEVLPTVNWSAHEWLDNNPYTSRTIYYYSPAAANKLKLFTYDNLLADGQDSYFLKAYLSSGTSPHGSLSQFCTSGAGCLSSSDQTSASGDNLIKYLSGDQSNIGAPTDTTKFYWLRESKLGDIVNSEAVFVGAPNFRYQDEGYTAFLEANASRQRMVYVGANDGMLHAFKATDKNLGGGTEVWAYVPKLVLPSLYVLADKNYGDSGKHRYLVDGTPVIGDICPSAGAQAGNIGCSASEWRTILVGGLGKGGRGYYALDITNPTSPKALWEFTNANLGYSYGNPIITKLRDGTWVVIVASGYNNVPDSLQNSGDGHGHLYVLKAATGELLRTIDTGATGSIARINSWVDDIMSDNTALRIYGGDEDGGVWRFDINGDYGAAGYDAQLLATVKDPSGNAQPITGRPELGMVGDYPAVFVGTGRLLGLSDLADTSTQSLYAIKDTLDATNFGNPRGAGTGFVQQSLTAGTCPPGSLAAICNSSEEVNISSRNLVDWSVNNGWYLDLPNAGGRINTDLALAYGVLVANVNVPSSQTCDLGGSSYRFFTDYRTGSALKSSPDNVVAVKMAQALTSRPVLGALPNNKLMSWSRLANLETPENQLLPTFSGQMRRISWREIPTDR